MSFMGNITHFFSYFIPFQTHCDYSVYRYYIAEEDAPKFILKTFLKIKSTFLIKFSLNKDKHTHKTYLLQKPLSSFSFEEKPLLWFLRQHQIPIWESFSSFCSCSI